jgi:hypothetical protein
MGEGVGVFEGVAPGLIDGVTEGVGVCDAVRVAERDCAEVSEASDVREAEVLGEAVEGRVARGEPEDVAEAVSHALRVEVAVSVSVVVGPTLPETEAVGLNEGTVEPVWEGDEESEGLPEGDGALESIESAEAVDEADKGGLPLAEEDTDAVGDACALVEPLGETLTLAVADELVLGDLEAVGDGRTVTVTLGDGEVLVERLTLAVADWESDDLEDMLMESNAEMLGEGLEEVEESGEALLVVELKGLDE